jgi:Dolichyl-phosphate-mannose-protein mannosyltransferase
MWLNRYAAEYSQTPGVAPSVSPPREENDMEGQSAGDVSRAAIWWLDVPIVLLLIAASVFMFRKLVPAEPFGYDEGDYMYVASKGFLSSYLDEPSVSLITFIKTGITSGLHSEKWRGLSAYIRQTDDITLYRHFHGPLYFYGLGFIQSLCGPAESTVRWASFLSLMLTAVIVYFGSLSLAGKTGRLAAFLAVGFLLLSPTSVEGARWALPHGLYSAFAMGTLFCAAKLVQTNRPGYLYGALLSLSLAFLSIEYAPLLVGVLAVTIFTNRKKLFRGMAKGELVRMAAICATIPLVVIGTLWPAGIYKLSLIKTYLFFSYISAIRSQAYGTAPLPQVWWTRFISSPVEYTLLLTLSCYILYVCLRKRQHLYLQPFLLYTLLMSATTIRNHSEAAIHVLSLIPCLAVLAAYAVFLLLKDAQPQVRGAIAVMVVVGLAVNNYWFYYRKEVTKPADERLTAVVNILRASNVGRQHLLVPQNLIPTIHYYFRRADLTGYTESTRVQDVSRKVVDGGFSELVYEGDRYQELRAILAKSWSIREVVIREPHKPGRAVAYYHLEPMRSSGGRPVAPDRNRS